MVASFCAWTLRNAALLAPGSINIDTGGAETDADGVDLSMLPGDLPISESGRQVGPLEGEADQAELGIAEVFERCASRLAVAMLSADAVFIAVFAFCSCTAWTTASRRAKVAKRLTPVDAPKVTRLWLRMPCRRCCCGKRHTTDTCPPLLHSSQLERAKSKVAVAATERAMKPVVPAGTGRTPTATSAAHAHAHVVKRMPKIVANVAQEQGGSGAAQLRQTCTAGVPSSGSRLRASSPEATLLPRAPSPARVVASSGARWRGTSPETSTLRARSPARAVIQAQRKPPQVVPGMPRAAPRAPSPARTATAGAHQGCGARAQENCLSAWMRPARSLRKDAMPSDVATCQSAPGEQELGPNLAMRPKRNSRKESTCGEVPHGPGTPSEPEPGLWAGMRPKRDSRKDAAEPANGSLASAEQEGGLLPGMRPRRNSRKDNLAELAALPVASTASRSTPEGAPPRVRQLKENQPPSNRKDSVERAVRKDTAPSASPPAEHVAGFEQKANAVHVSTDCNRLHNTALNAAANFQQVLPLCSVGDGSCGGWGSVLAVSNLPVFVDDEFASSPDVAASPSRQRKPVSLTAAVASEQRFTHVPVAPVGAGGLNTTPAPATAWRPPSVAAVARWRAASPISRRREGHGPARFQQRGATPERTCRGFQRSLQAQEGTRAAGIGQCNDAEHHSVLQLLRGRLDKVRSIQLQWRLGNASAILASLGSVQNPWPTADISRLRARLEASHRAGVSGLTENDGVRRLLGSPPLRLPPGST